jgi:pyruvate/2-oxoglutarate dehydrogenase complex dihydrolipoamide acyltransferase (E2) component
MAEKRSKSILSGLKNMLHLEPGQPSKPAAKAPASKPKKTASAEKRAAPAPAPAPKEQPSTEAAAAPDSAAEPKPDKQRVKQQPWYRHRQRW